MESNVPVEFPRGFLYGEDLSYIPAGYRKVEEVERLYAHAWTPISSATESQSFAVVLGHCVSTENVEEQAAECLVRALSQGERVFFKTLERFTGRYVVIFGQTGQINFVTDAAGMRSVFYSADGDLVASHALLIERNLPGQVERLSWQIGRGYPGNRVPYKRVRILTPNSYYAFNENRIYRFWPTEPIPSQTVESSSLEVLERMSTGIRGLAKRGPIKSSLTAGSDSRCLLATALYSGVGFETYTYGTRYRTLVDRQAAAEISRAVGIKHTVPESETLSPMLKSALADANYTNLHWSNVPGLISWIGDSNAIVLMEILLEIGTGASAVNFPDQPAPTDAEAMALLYIKTMPYKKRQSVEEKNYSQYLEFATGAFEDWIEATGGPNPSLINPYVQFFWEHRMATWHGPTMAERDFYATPINPSNSISIYKAMLGVSDGEQKSGVVPKAIVERVEPKLLQFPVNPKRWERQS